MNVKVSSPINSSPLIFVVMASVLLGLVVAQYVFPNQLYLLLLTILLLVALIVCYQQRLKQYQQHCQLQHQQHIELLNRLPTPEYEAAYGFLMANLDAVIPAWQRILASSNEDMTGATQALSEHFSDINAVVEQGMQDANDDAVQQRQQRIDAQPSGR